MLMELKLLELIYSLKESEPLRLYSRELAQLNNEINNNEEIIRLCMKKENAINEYGFCLDKFGKNNSKTLNAAVNMSKSIEELNLNSIVNQYNKILTKYLSLINDIEKVIFDF